ncbi:MAG: zinc ribbon domain-containing protein [Thermomicrobiales bacterium]
MTARDSSSSSAQRICPKCGHANSTISLFCAECGAVLNGALDDDGGTSAFTQPITGATMSASNDSSPRPTAEQEWASMMASSGDDANATAPLPRMTPPVSSVSAPPAPAPSGPTYETTPSTWASTPAGAGSSEASAQPLMPASGISFGVDEEPHSSMRGFWFGVIGFLLILAVLGLYGWSILPEGGFRDTVTGWF